MSAAISAPQDGHARLVLVALRPFASIGSLPSLSVATSIGKRHHESMHFVHKGVWWSWPGAGDAVWWMGVIHVVHQTDPGLVW
ncbi:hypothetical protein GCM10010428_69030 [Actinosynnema pretiosum subsp. pretiosum]